MKTCSFFLLICLLPFGLMGQNVGIGTALPTQKLEVSEDGSVIIRITSADNGNPGLDLFRPDTAAHDWRMLSDTGTYLRFQHSPDLEVVAAADLMVLNGTGSEVSINGKVIAEKLQVTTGASYNYVLASDWVGNATWQDVNNLISDDGDWTVVGFNLFNTGLGNVGIGTVSPTQRLHVAGNILTDAAYLSDGITVIDDNAGSHRTVGNTGWINETYGGGWYMSDWTWVRTYNQKGVFLGAGILRADGGLQVGNSGNRFKVSSQGVVDINPGNTPLSIRIDTVWNGSFNEPGIYPSLPNFGYIGQDNNRWHRVYSEDVYTWNGSGWDIYDTYNDLELLNSIEADTLWDPALNHHVMRIKPLSIPKIITDYDSHTYDPSSPNISQKRMNGFLMGVARQLDRETKERDQHLAQRYEILANAMGFPEGRKAEKMIVDNGQATASEKLIHVPFSDEFRSKLKAGKEASVNITPRSEYITYYVSEVDANGFTLVVKTDQPQFTFNWMAFATVPVQSSSEAERPADIFDQAPVRVEGNYPAIDYMEREKDRLQDPAER
jgi:hypothetical protein